eukprot:10059646-Lingulodinium_polyedra.AAC.1
MGVTATPLAELCRAAETPELRRCPAVALVDQEKPSSGLGSNGSSLSCRGAARLTGRSAWPAP